MRGSLDNNELCGIDMNGDGTYTTKGINKLCESLKTSPITSLRCSNARWGPCHLVRSAPAEQLHAL